MVVHMTGKSLKPVCKNFVAIRLDVILKYLFEIFDFLLMVFDKQKQNVTSKICNLYTNLWMTLC